ncbi:cysteine desulfurase family protein [Sphingobacterium bambusae]|uniref:cysteine desulfurase n=1 Tax=Sphingobacterium bambusae TaxID=662858 RepID=A0ABW6BPT8_9SPHI|nr:cysteine desulfurase family protein [Sphingobacterium bambusae]WPL47903.1 cysteine desulfurase family protein [Sphingobacterium bambusae]
MQNDFIYLDNNATTPLDPRVLASMMPYLTDMFGNAASSHKMGRQIKTAVEQARGQVGELLDVNEEDIYFTAGATEAINIALQGIPARAGQAKHIITVQTEHPAVLDTCRYLETIGVEVTYLSVDDTGLIDFEELKQAFQDNTVLVCVMFVNNETGVIQDLTKIADIAHERGALFMTDATQGVGKFPLYVPGKIDILAFSAHKFYGPKGIGGLYVNPYVRLKSLVYGGGHERGLRSGTLNVSGIVGLGKAAEIAQQEILRDEGRISQLRAQLEEALLQIPGTRINGAVENRLSSTSNICFDGVDNEAMLLGLKDICVSNGSACHSLVMEPSHVLLAMGLTKEQANSSIRFSLGRFNTEEEIKHTADAVSNAVARLRAMAF